MLVLDISGSLIVGSRFSVLMRKLLLTAVATFLVSNGYGAALNRATFTQVVNQVRVVSATSGIRPAKVRDPFNNPDLIRTGPRSLAELTAPDKTITRVGSNTIFLMSDGDGR